MLTITNLSKDPFYNLALEEYIFNKYTEDDIFFMWQDEPSVIVGSYQNIFREVTVLDLEKQHIPILRRMTGGGTVYHDNGNINYTYITTQAGMIDYADCVKPIIDGLNALGISAYQNRTCDIAINGKKISGSAQRMVRKRLLHHGTLLFSSDLDRLFTVTMKDKNNSIQSKGTVSAICPVTNIIEYLPKPMSLEDFKQQLQNQILGNTATEIILDENDQAEIQKLRDKYMSWKWIWEKTPPFTYQKSGTFCDSPITVRYSAKKGILYDVEIHSQHINPKQVTELLDLSRLDLSSLREKCHLLAAENEDALLTFFT